VQFKQRLDFACGGFDIGCCKHGGNDRDSIGTVIDQLRRIGRSDAADRHQRHRKTAACFSQQFQRWPYCIGLDAGRKKTAESDVVGTRGQRLLRKIEPVITGSTQQALRAERGVILAAGAIAAREATVVVLTGTGLKATPRYAEFLGVSI